MSLAAARNWLDCTVKLVYFCQMIIQGYMVNECNIIMLPYINRENLRSLKDRLKKLPSFNSNLSIPFLRTVMENKATASQLSSALTDLLGSKASSEVIKAIYDMPILTVRTTIKNHQNNEIIPSTMDQEVINIRTRPGTDCIFELNIFREGSTKMNVNSKKFNKQKEEFWFLIFVERGNINFRKFSFSRRNKKIDLPVQLPPQRGNYRIELLYFRANVLKKYIISYIFFRCTRI